MGIRSAIIEGRRRPDPASSWPAARASFRDARLALRLFDRLGRDGWRVDWSRREDGSWEARVGSPLIRTDAVAWGLSRVAAISAAHVEALHAAGLASSELARIHQP